jgi:energy-coupling factor transporter ATP-binding protein EcfA2
MNILIPQLKKVKLYGFYPIFSQVVEFEINENLFLILGGNGLGKTTILQSVIYGMAGPADDNIESKENKGRRWNRNYFKERLENSNNASIEVTFYLGDNKVVLKRGFISDKILEFHLNDEVITTDKQLTDDYFEQFLDGEGGYSNIRDFYFVVHKLCYLSEKRENLAWDLDAQIRILMQIFSDILDENKFRNKRNEIRELDSKIRHRTVDINYLDKRIALARETKDDDVDITPIKVKKESSLGEIDISVLQKDLLDINAKLITKQKEYKNLKERHSTTTTEVDRLREIVAEYEHAFFFEQLNNLESNEAKLAIHKLIHYKLCPSCGNKSEDLYRQAIEFLKNECCPICGTDQILNSDSVYPGTEAELSERLNEKVNLEKSIIQIEKELEIDSIQLNDLNLKINGYLLARQPAVMFIDKTSSSVETESIEKLESALQNLQFERNELVIQFNKLKQIVDDEYESFNKINNSRIELLSKFYEKYATEFLGIPCTLETIDSSDKFLDLKLLVPSFNNKVRKTSDSCSEAQRFFLDIAFRMALIQLVSELSGFKGSFLCETPENALDITYIDNVADMFEIFSRENKNTLLMTSNIQSGGIAESLLSKVKGKENRLKMFLNLIEIGNLSTVQSTEHGRSLLDEQLKKIIGK